MAATVGVNNGREFPQLEGEIHIGRITTKMLLESLRETTIQLSTMAALKCCNELDTHKRIALDMMSGHSGGVEHDVLL